MHWKLTALNNVQVPDLNLKNSPDYREALKNITLEPIIKTSFLNVSSPLPYLGDRALANRQLTNRIAEIFLDNNSLKTPLVTIKKVQEKLTIGYLASTLKHHSVGWLSRWLIHHHDREKLQIAIYTINQEEDEITRQWFRVFIC